VNALAIAAIVFAAIFGSALLGTSIRPLLREHHTSNESRDVVKTGMGLVATMAALVLGLLVASAKSSYDTQRDGLAELAANLTLLDTILEQYGASAREPREILRGTVATAIERLWPADASHVATLGTAELGAGGRSFHASILALSPANDMQRALQSQAMQIATSLAHTRLLLVAESDSTAVSGIFLAVLSFWLAVLFGSFGLFAPRNALTLTALLISALSVSGAIFLILELAHPFNGVIQLSSTPLRNALAHLGT
jgi:hypothetical protein